MLYPRPASLYYWSHTRKVFYCSSLSPFSQAAHVSTSDLINMGKMPLGAIGWHSPQRTPSPAVVRPPSHSLWRWEYRITQLLLLDQGHRPPSF